MNYAGRSVAAALGLVAYAPFAATIVQTSATDFYARHIVFVPVLAALLLWMDRHRFRELTGEGGVGGPVVAAAALGLLAFGYATGSILLQALSLAGTLAGFIWWRHGPHGLRRSAFVLVFLLLSVPPPVSVIAAIAPGIQHAVAGFAAAVGEVLQIPVEQDGILLRLPAITLQVAEACAGLRFALVLFVLVAAFARLVLPSGSAQALLIVLSIPVVMVANAMRVATIAVGAHAVGPHVAMGPLHDYIGKAFWMAALLTMIGLAMRFRSREMETRVRPALTGDSLSFSRH